MRTRTFATVGVIIGLAMFSTAAHAQTLSGTAFCGNSPMDRALIEAVDDTSQTLTESSITNPSGAYSLSLVPRATLQSSASIPMSRCKGSST